MTTLTEDVYEQLPDGRVIVAGIAGDELDDRTAERLKVAKDGKSSNGVKPATELTSSHPELAHGSNALDETPASSSKKATTK